MQHSVQGADPVMPIGDEAEDTAGEPQGTHLLELWSDREEARAIPGLLRPGEGVVCVGSGTILRSGRLAQPRWLVVLTDRRVICIKGSVPATRRIIEMPVGAIRSVTRKGILRITLTLDTGYGNLRLGNMKKHVAHELVDGLNALMRASRGDAAGLAIPRAELPAGPDPDVARLAETIIELRAEVDDLRTRVNTLELASDTPLS